MIWTLLYKLWLYFTGITSHPHPSDQHVVHYIIVIKNIFEKSNCFLQTYVIWKNTQWNIIV